MIRIIISSALILLSTLAQGQYTTFKAQALSTNQANRQDLNAEFSKYRLYKLNPAEIYRFVQKQTTTVATFRLYFDESHQWVFSITPAKVTNTGFVVHQGDDILQTANEIHTYKGYVIGDAQTKVRLSIRERTLNGYVKLASGRQLFFEHIDSQPHTMILYDTEALKKRPGCKTTATNQDISQTTKNQSGMRTTSCLVVPIAYAANTPALDKEGGSVESLKARLETYTNVLNELYGSMGIQYTLSELYIANGSESWNDRQGGTTDAFMKWAQEGGFTSDYGAALLWHGNTGGGFAYVNQICGDFGFATSSYGIKGGSTIYLAAHELGHMWGADHVSDNRSIMNPVIWDDSNKWHPTTIATISNTKTKEKRTKCLLPCSGNIGNGFDFTLTPSNIISPNGDAQNDTWIIKGSEKISGLSVRIFSRSGQLVFESSNYTKPWDGTKNGQVLPAGVYYYTIKAGSITSVSGYLTLVR